MKTRLQGIVLLALCVLALRLVFLLVQARPAHQASLAELALGLAAVLSGMFGAASLLVGPALFRPYAWPPPDGD
jgi:hypothetical protein